MCWFTHSDFVLKLVMLGRPMEEWNVMMNQTGAAGRVGYVGKTGIIATDAVQPSALPATAYVSRVQRRAPANHRPVKRSIHGQALFRRPLNSPFPY